MITLPDEEYFTICALAEQAAKLQGEDVIGALMKMGAFRIVDEIVVTAERVEHGKNVYEKMYDTKLAIEKEANRKKKS